MSRDCYEIILNHDCDLACGFCSQVDFDQKVRSGLAAAVRHIYSARKAGYRRLGFSGGEALLREDLPALISAARGVGFRTIRLQTNGARLSSLSLCRRLAEAGLTVCKFTFLAGRASIHDRLTGIPGSFGKSLAGLDNMLALKLSVGVNLLATRLNYRELGAALKFFMDRGAADFTLIYPIYTGAMRQNSASLGVALPEASPHFTKALDLALAAGLGGGVKALNIPPCLLPGHERRAVDLYRFNTVVASPRGPLRDLDADTALDKTHGPPCAACVLRERCGGVDRRHAALFGWAGFSPIRKLRTLRIPEPERGYLSGLEKCFLETLKIRDGLSTAEVLRAARTIPLCHDCRDGAGVLTTGAGLVKKGLVKKSFRKGAYIWRLA